MLRIIYVVLKTGRPYYDRTADYEALMVKRNAPRWIRMLRRYGYIEPAGRRPQGRLTGLHRACRLRGTASGHIGEVHRSSPLRRRWRSQPTP